MTFVILHDSCPNREGVTPSKIQSMLQSAFDLAQSESVPLACLVIQVDDLRSIAHAYGGGVVDRILKSVVRILESQPGMEDEMGFLFDDRFLLGVPGMSQENVEKAAEEILSRTRGLRVEVEGRAVPAKLSIGVASSNSAAFPRVDELLLDTLIQVAREGSEVANSSGGDKWVHTELYTLVQKGFERKEPDKVDAQRQRIVELRDLPERPSVTDVLNVVRPNEPAAPLQVDAPVEPLPAPEPKKSNKPIRPNGHPVDILSERRARQQAAEKKEEEVKAQEPPAAPELPPLPTPPPPTPEAKPESQKAKPASRDASAEALEIGDLVRKVLGGAAPNELPASQREMFENLRQWIEAEKGKTADEQAAQIKILERRISKLNDALSETESELGRVIKMKAIDPGVASVFRDVQGLSEEDANYEAKKAIMQEIFKANLKLAAREE